MNSHKESDINWAALIGALIGTLLIVGGAAALVIQSSIEDEIETHE